METQILIVDDDAAVCGTMKEFIELSGYKVGSVSSAEAAVEFLKTDSVQIVITDIMLPGMNGLDLTAIIKKSYDTDVIVITGHSTDDCYEDAINKGASDFLFKPIRLGELLIRLKKVLKDREAAKKHIQMIAELQTLAITDGLTKLYNSRHFYHQLKSEIHKADSQHLTLSLLLLDIDHFKHYNDFYGHLKGDKVLLKIGQMIQSCLRKKDSAYRYGGEEFTVILPETAKEGAKVVAQRLRAAIEAEKFFPEQEKPATVTVSIGVTEYADKEGTAAFVSRADRAMFISKQKGRNTITVLDRENNILPLP
ncbi:MAG: diguanylate cyclase response regulator [Desulfobacteraceae bacterium IS3]|nr:MAG: diguanylate cyclase response regulator [Desulfobacteraceae bacterium IS3]